MKHSGFLTTFFPKALIMALLMQPVITPELLSNNFVQEHEAYVSLYHKWLPRIAVTLGITALVGLHVKCDQKINIKTEAAIKKYRTSPQQRRGDCAICLDTADDAIFLHGSNENMKGHCVCAGCLKELRNGIDKVGDNPCTGPFNTKFACPICRKPIDKNDPLISQVLAGN